MALGYDGKLYILAFDHRGSFQKKMFGIEGDPTPEQTETIADAKRLIFEGMEQAVERAAQEQVGGHLGPEARDERDDDRRDDERDRDVRPAVRPDARDLAGPQIEHQASSAS